MLLASLHIHATPILIRAPRQSKTSLPCISLRRLLGHVYGLSDGASYSPPSGCGGGGSFLWQDDVRCRFDTGASRDQCQSSHHYECFGPCEANFGRSRGASFVCLTLPPNSASNIMEFSFAHKTYQHTSCTVHTALFAEAAPACCLAIYDPNPFCHTIHTSLSFSHHERKNHKRVGPRSPPCAPMETCAIRQALIRASFSSHAHPLGSATRIPQTCLCASGPLPGPTPHAAYPYTCSSMHRAPVLPCYCDGHA
jgi:hypothetical protein